MSPKPRISWTGQRNTAGAALIESMISIMIMGFGIVALAGMQMNLTRGAETARQQTEAVQLAREQMELLRTQAGLEIKPIEPYVDTLFSSQTGWQDTGSDSHTSNSTYQRSWHVGTPINQGSHPVNVQVGWTDRTDVKHHISLSTVMSHTNPADSGAVYFAEITGEMHTYLRPAIAHIAADVLELPNGITALKFGTLDQYLLMDRTTGWVRKLCKVAPILNGTDMEDRMGQVTAAIKGDACLPLNALVISGFISRDASLSDSNWLTIQSALGMDASRIRRTPAHAATIQCQLSNVRDERSGLFSSNFKAYLCIIPLAITTARGEAPGAANWSGTWLLSGPPAWRLPHERYFVCRYEYVADATKLDANQRNVQPYVAVGQSIHQQNYRIAATLDASSTSSPTCPADMRTFSAAASALTVGVLHQDCRSASNPAAYSSACPVLQ